MTTIEQTSADVVDDSLVPPLRYPIVRTAIAALVLIVLTVQPNPLRLIEITRATRSADSAESALPLLLEGFRRQPWNAGRAEAAGYGALLAGEYDTAIEMLTVAAGLDEWTAPRHVAAGDALNGLADTPGALQHWEAALAATPVDPNLLGRLAATYETAGMYTQAMTAYEGLARQRPTDAVIHYRLGVIRAVLEPANARESLALASGLEPELRPATAVLDAAVEYALSIADPAPGAGLIGYALINLQEYGLAEVALQAAIDADPDYADAYAYLGLAADRRGGDGLAQYERALDLDADSALAHTFLGLYWKRHGDIEHALQALDRAYQLDPLNAAVSAELAGVYEAQADLATAEEWYQNAVRLAPTDAAFWTLLARFYLDHDYKAVDQGLPAAQAAAELGPVYAPAHDALGHALLMAGRPGEAESALLRALEVDAEFAPTYYHLGLAYVELNRIEDAVRNLQAALTLDPDGPTGNLALNTLARLPQE